MKVLLTIPLAENHIKQLEDLGYEILFENDRKSDFSDDYSDVEVFITFSTFLKLPRERLPKLRWIQLSSIGFDQVPASFHDVVITNNQGGYSPQIGEWVVGMMLALAKRFHAIYDNQQAKRWKMQMDVESLDEQTVLFVGTGTLAQETVKRLQGFGMTVLGLNQSGHAVSGFHETFPLTQAMDVLPRADYVIICLPATDKTKGLVNQDWFNAMKPGTNLINISRGAVINEEELIKHHDHLGMIALDVFEVEPLPETSPLWQLPNVIISSHNSWVNQHIQSDRFNLFYDNLKRFANGEELRNVVTIARGY